MLNAKILKQTKSYIAKQKTKIKSLGKTYSKEMISNQKRKTNDKVNIPALNLDSILSKKINKNKLVISNIKYKDNLSMKMKKMPKQKSRNLNDLNKTLNTSSSQNNDYFNTLVSRGDKILYNYNLINKYKCNIIPKENKMKYSPFLTIYDNITNKNKAAIKNNNKSKIMFSNANEGENIVNVISGNINNDNTNIIKNALISISSNNIFNNKIKTSSNKTIKLNKPKNDSSKVKMKILLDNNESKIDLRRCETERDNNVPDNSNIISIFNRKHKKNEVDPIIPKNKPKSKNVILKNSFNYNNISTNINTTNNININSLKIINEHFKNKPKNIINNFITETNKASVKSSFFDNELNKSNSLSIIKITKNQSTRNINIKNRQKNNIINGSICYGNSNNKNNYMRSTFRYLMKNNIKSVSNDKENKNKYKKFCNKRKNNNQIMKKKIKNFEKITNLPLKYFNKTKKNFSVSNGKNKGNNSKNKINKMNKQNSLAKRLFTKKMKYDGFYKKSINRTLISNSTNKNSIRTSNHSSNMTCINNRKLVNEKKTSGNSRKNNLKTMHKYLFFRPFEINFLKSNEKIQKNKKFSYSETKKHLKIKDERDKNEFILRKTFSEDILLVSVNDNVKKNIKLTKENNDLNKIILSLQEQILNEINNDINQKTKTNYENTTSVQTKKDINKQNEENIKDPQQVKEYLNEIIFTLLKEEQEAKDKGYIDPYYLISKEREITPEMRTMIIDWLFEVHQLFNFQEKSLFMTVQLMDRFLTKETIESNELQLLILTCINISSKHEELEYPILDNFITVSGYNYTADDMIKMESRVLRAIDWEIVSPNLYDFFQIFSSICELNPIENSQGVYILNIILMDVNMLKYSISLLAFVVIKIVTKKNIKIIVDILKEIKNEVCKNDYKEKEDIDKKNKDIKLIESIIINFNDIKIIEEIEQKIRILFRTVLNTQYCNARNKFNAQKFYAVSTYTSI